MRYDKLVRMMKDIVQENIQHRASSRSHSMAGRYGRRKNQIRLAQEQETTMTGQKANEIDPNPVIKGSINQTR